MENKKRAIIIVICFVLLMVGATVLYNSLDDKVDTQQLSPTVPPVQDETTEPSDPGVTDTPPADAEEPVPQKAPDVTFYDADGNTHKLSDYVGKPIVLNFWASWCSPCKMEMPDFESKYKELGEDITFLMVNMTTSQRETQDKAADFVAEQGFTFPVFYDTTGEVMTTYGVYSYPTTYFLDAEGNFVAYASGAIDAELLQQGIDMITA